MKDTDVGQPKDSEKQGYKFLLDTLREQLLKPKEIEVEEEPVAAHAAAPSMENASVAFPENKKYFRIGEVAELLGVEAYVLRYWESEFSMIRPKKSRSGQRIYDRRDVQQLANVHYLLHIEKFSLQGAKRKMLDLRKAASQAPQAKPVDRKALADIARDVRSLIALIERGA